jgi:rRNA maturation RNase YbeY
MIEKIFVQEGIELHNLGIILVDDAFLKSLHKKYLGEDSYTDVITFPIEEGEEREAEIYISLDRARINAERFKVNIEEEVARLIIHGLLHLQDFDDADATSKNRMKKEENRLLEKYWYNKTGK